VARVLIVDDNEVILSILSDFLGVGYEIDRAMDMAGALKAVATNPPDAIVLDVNSTAAWSLTLLSRMRSHGITIPVFVMTKDSSPQLAAQAKEAGATHYMVKPVDLRELDRLMADALNLAPMLG
jgi:DNA-binding NtrC family response regulator